LQLEPYKGFFLVFERHAHDATVPLLASCPFVLRVVGFISDGLFFKKEEGFFVA